MKPVYNAAFLAALADCADVLLPQVYGHEHADRLMLLTDANNRFATFPTLPAHSDEGKCLTETIGSFLMGPSILPDKANPAFRVFHYRTEPSFAFTDVQTYVLNLTKVALFLSI